MDKALVRRALVADVEPICELLHAKMNQKIPVERWRSLMSYPWLEHKPDFGRVVELDGRILGFCGMVYSDRLVGSQNPRKERVVSMSSWYLDKSLRGQGLGKRMLASAVSNPYMTYVTLTNSRKPLHIVESLGFKRLEDHRYVWHPVQHITASDSIQLITDLEQIKHRAKPIEKQLLIDMAGFPLTPVLLSTDSRQTLLFFSIKEKKHELLWFDLMYCSDFNHFISYAQQICDYLAPHDHSLLAVDGRFAVSPPKDAERQDLAVCRYFYGKRLQPNEIDHLYSELQLLDLKID